MECCRDGCPSGEVLPSQQRNSRAVRVTIGFLVTSLTKALLTLIAQFVRQALGRVLEIPLFFHLRMMEATVFLGTFNTAEMFWYPSPDLCLNTFLSRSSTENSFKPHGLVFALTFTVNCGTLYRQVCAFLNHVQSIEFTTGGLQSSCRNISRMINGNRLHLSSILSLIEKGLNAYVKKVFLFFYL